MATTTTARATIAALATTTTARRRRRRVLLQVVEYLLGGHAIILGVIQAHLGTVWIARKLHNLLVAVSGHNHAVNHVVTGDVGKAVVLVEQLAPYGQVPKPLVHGLVQTDKAQLLHGQGIHEGASVNLVAPVGICSLDLAGVVERGRTDRHNASPQAQARQGRTHDVDLGFLELALRGK